MRYFEEKESVNPFQVIISIIILAICLFSFYYLKGGSISENEFLKFANIQYIGMDGNPLEFREPVAAWVLSFWHGMTRLDILPAYQSFLAIVYSLFLHLLLLLFEREKWKLNHHIILFVTAFISFNIRFTYAYSSEMLCAIFIFTLILFCKMLSIFDILLLLIFSIAALYTNLSAFLVLFTIFVFRISFVKMKEDRMKTVVFYKKKSIASKILIVYSILFLAGLIFAGIFDTFGTNSFRFLAYSFFNLSWAFGPVAALLFIGKILMRTERELSGMISSVVLLVLLMVVLFYSYQNIEPVEWKALQKQKILQQQEEPTNA
ncbi:MAG: hypothetical protein AAF518_15835 [Spirochaetota bacterium]